MNKHILNILLAFTLCAITLTEVRSPVHAQENAGVVTFDQIQTGEIQLVGPFDSAGFAFGLPNNWKFNQGGTLNLSMSVSFNTAALVDEHYEQLIYGGTLTVFLNGVNLQVVPLNEVGETERSIQIPIDAFDPVLEDGRMFIRLVLNSSSACYIGSNEQMIVLIHLDSNFVLPYDLVPLSTNLVNFPRPIYQNTFVPDSALLVVPDDPSPAELQGALTISAGLGNLTENALLIDMATASGITPEQRASNHLIFIGKGSALPDIRTLQLPLRTGGNGEFPITEVSADDGVIQMINSPWSDAHVLMIVSGNTDAGVLKASQAVSTGLIRTNRVHNLAIVQEVETDPVLTSRPVDQTFSDLGYEDVVFEERGVNGALYNFYIPPGWNVTEEAYLELAFNHSTLLNYDRSGIVVILNNRPIGSVRLNDTSAGQPDNQVQITLPDTLIIPGTNTLIINTNLVPYDYCAPVYMRGLWVGILETSKLHLPLLPSVVVPGSNLDLSSYPEPFIHEPTLRNTAFVVPQKNLEVWRGAVQIAAYLGLSANGPLTTLAVFYDGQIPEVGMENYNMIVIGQPSQMSILDKINNYLPAPFLDESDIAQESNLQVIYRIPADSPLGYVEIAPSPWKAENVVLALLGNTAQGVEWATSALSDEEMRGQLSGNFAVVNDQQLITSDTRLLPAEVETPVASEPFAPPVAPAVPPILDLEAQPSTHPNWMLPALIVTIILFILILALVLFGNRLQNLTRRKHTKE